MDDYQWSECPGLLCLIQQERSTGLADRASSAILAASLFALTACAHTAPKLENAAAATCCQEAHPAAAPERVGQEVLVPEKLTVHVFAHALQTQSGPLPVWTFASSGLWPLGQREIFFTVKRGPGKSADAYPRDLLDVYRDIQKLAEQGRLVDIGGITGLTKSLLGRDGFRCIVYTGHQRLEGIPVESPSLTALIVSCDEMRFTLHYGLTRLMARLGYRERFYPTAPWADPARAEVASPTEPQSLLTRMRTLPFYKGAVIREKSGKVLLKMLPGAKELLRDLRARADSPDLLAQDMLTLLVRVDPSADGCFVWQPGQQSQGAITRFRSGDRLSANFINFAVLEGDRVHDESRLFEDGVTLLISRRTWAAINDALTQGSPLALPGIGSGFEITWLPESYEDPVTGTTYHSPEGWHTYFPKGPARPDLSGEVKGVEFILLTPEAEISRRIEVQALAALISSIDASVVAQAEATRVTSGFDLIVDCEVDANGGKAFRLAFRADPASPFAEGLQKRLEQVQPPPVRNGSIHFQSLYRVHGGSGQRLLRQ